MAFQLLSTLLLVHDLYLVHVLWTPGSYDIATCIIQVRAKYMYGTSWASVCSKSSVHVGRRNFPRGRVK